MTAPDKIVELVEDFKRNEKDFNSKNSKNSKNKRKKEQYIRTHFLNPFFKELGWDFANEDGVGEKYMEAFEEKPMEFHKNLIPDYTFRLSGEDIFYADAKDTNVKLFGDKLNRDAAYQIRNYGYQGDSHLSIITNFKDFVVYDTRKRFKPKKRDKHNLFIKMHFNYEEYEEKWDEIYNLFSKDAVKTYKYDNYFIDNKDEKEGSLPVDEQFLEDIQEWRKLLAQNIALRNQGIGVDDLNFAVQQIIDRIIFFRIAEDRHIIRKDFLKKLYIEKKDETIYSQFIQKCKWADDYYNSGLFHFKKESDDDNSFDNITEDLIIDDSKFKRILESLYYPNCDYDFSEISLEILGRIYEEFLSVKIRLTQGHFARVNDINHANKENGIYYTPQKVTNYIVKNTVGKAIEKVKTPNKISKIKILDPSCGSGTFLLAAYDFLLDYHLNYYKKSGNPPKNSLFTDKDGNKLLTINEKRRILTNNIYGVDIDSRATEITKLSLLLKVLEGQMKDEEEKQRRLDGEKILPNLDNNIKCGNSLVDTDVYNDKYKNVTIEGHMDYPFNYQDNFTEIFQDETDGFDIIIGNPPYIRTEYLPKIFKKYLKEHYDLYTQGADIYIYFFEKSLNLLKKNGYLGFICSNKYVTTLYGSKLRKKLSNDTFIIKYLECEDIFDKAQVETSVIIIQNKNNKNKEISLLINGKKSILDQNMLNENVWVFKNTQINNLKNKILNKGKIVKDIKEISIEYGIKTGRNKAFVINKNEKSKFIRENPNYNEIIKPVLGGKHILNWNINYKDDYLIFTKQGIDITKYRGIEKYLEQYKEILKPTGKPGRKEGSYKWYEIQDQVEYHEDFNKPKLIYAELSRDVRIFFDNQKFYLLDSAFMITHQSDDEFYLKVLGTIFSSNVLNFYILLTATQLNNNVRHLKGTMEDCPIVSFDKEDTRIVQLKENAENIQSESMRLREIINELKEKITPDKMEKLKSEKKIRENNIQNLNDQINDIVYDLYDITDDEKQIIEKELDSKS